MVNFFLRGSRPVVDVIKLFGGNLDFTKIKKFHKVCHDV